MKLHHILESGQFNDNKILDSLFREASRLEDLAGRGELPQTMRGRVMATLFYEPSTRTRLSFESAMKRLGGSVIGTDDASRFSSAVKGESLPDTIRVTGSYADVIVLRHPREGAAKIAAECSPVPVINAGDGAGQHPTQALLDMYTIWKEFGRTDRLSVAMAGDLLYGRTVHSLTCMLAHHSGNSIFFVSPHRLRIPERLRQYLKDSGVLFRETECLEDVAGRVDVLYMTRIQKERFPSDEEYSRLRDCYVVDRKFLDKMKEKSIIMHPLPRVSEISPEVDGDPRAAYFRQAGNGLYVRMALLNMVFGDADREAKE
jgi:aspartate carbamoyltransferase catalytic subunit